jgi:hypothetical protein
MAVVGRLPGPCEVERHAVCVGPRVERLRRELGAMIHGDRARQAPRRAEPIEHYADAGAGDALDYLSDRTLATPLIDDGEDPKRAAVRELVVHKVHASALPRTRRCRHRAAM